MNILIIGAGPQALYVLRCLAEAGHTAYVVAFDNKVACYSKYGEKYVAHDSTDFINYLESKKDIIDKAYICGGKELQFILDEFPDIFKIYDVYPKPMESIKVFSDKKSTYSFLSDFGAIAPKSYNINELLGKAKLANPLIIKWNQELPTQYSAAFKTKVFYEINDLKTFLINLEHDLHPFVIVQDFIVGNESNNVSLQVAFDNKELKGSLLTKKIRVSKNGYTSYIEEMEVNDKFKEQALRPFIDGLVELNYSGLAEAEFKFCDTTGDYYLIEVNPRPCGLVSALKGKYKNFNSFFEGIELIENNKIVRWSSIGRDLQTCVMNFKKDHSLKAFLKNLYSIISANTYDVFSLKDLKPFFSQFRTKK